MDKATPVEMRKSLEVVESLKRAMIRFIPIPVLNEADNIRLVDILNTRIHLIGTNAENDKKSTTE